MVDLDTLATFDSLIGLQTGEEVGQRFQFIQRSVNRIQRKCSPAFGVELRNVEAEWHGFGDPLDLEALADLPSLAPGCPTLLKHEIHATVGCGV